MPLLRGKQIEADSITAAQVDDSTGSLSTINAGDAEVSGALVSIANKGHQHAVATGAATAQIDVGDAAAEGASSNLAREDHQHALPAPAAPADVTKAAASAGAATTVARADHKHDVTTAAAVELAEANAEGVATTLARSDHTHDHGNRSGGTLHAAATISVAGFMSAADKVKLDASQTLSEIDAKESCRIRTQADDTLSGLAARDGVTPIAGDRVLVDSQTTATEDGIYEAAVGAWTRSADMPTGTEARGVRVAIEEGSVDADRLYMCTNNAGSDVVGTDGLTFALIGAGSPRGAGAGTVLNGNDIDVVAANASIVVAADDITVGVLQTDAMHGVRGGGTQHANAIAAGAAGFITGADKTKLDGIEALAEVNDTPQQEAVTTQVITGADTALTDVLNNTPISNASVVLYLNGLQQKQGATFDYTISGTTITWLASTGTAVDMDTSDTLDAVYLS